MNNISNQVFTRETAVVVTGVFIVGYLAGKLIDCGFKKETASKIKYFVWTVFSLGTLYFCVKGLPSSIDALMSRTKMWNGTGKSTISFNTPNDPALDPNFRNTVLDQNFNQLPDQDPSNVLDPNPNQLPVQDPSLMVDPQGIELDDWGMLDNLPVDNVINPRVMDNHVLSDPDMVKGLLVDPQGIETDSQDLIDLQGGDPNDPTVGSVVNSGLFDDEAHKIGLMISMGFDRFLYEDTRN